MISVGTARRAEEFAALVDGAAPRGAARDADLLEVVTTLRQTAAVEPRADFVTELRARLMAEADTALVPTDTRLTLPARTRTRRDRRIAIATGAVVLVGATSSMAVAAQNALPGDALYPIKRVLESAETSLKVDDQARADQMLDNASGRLEEAEKLALRDNAEAYAALPDTLDDFVAQANEAADLLIEQYDETGDPQHIVDLREFAQESLDMLASLDAAVPLDLRDVVAWAAQQLAAIDQLAQDVCPACGGGITEIPSNLINGSALVPVTAVAPTTTLEPGATDPSLLDIPLVTEPATAPDAPKVTDDTKKTVDEVTAPTTDDPVKQITDDVLGDGDGNDGLLGAVVNPLLDPLIGEGGLLNP